MDWNLKKILRPVFDLMASPGLGNPHTPYEAELMVAGVKPVAIMDPEAVTAAMQRSIDAGTIVEIATIANSRTERLYCRPEAIGDARRAADVLAQSAQSHTLPSESDQKFLADFFCYNNLSAAEAYIDMRGDAYDVEGALFKGRTHERMTDLLAGNIAALPPVLFEKTQMPNIPLEEALAKGTLAAVDIRSELLTKVFAQSGKVEEGKELYARYYKDSEGYQRLEGDEAAKRVGHLLGFTDNDVAWFTGEKYQNPAVHKLMEMTNGIRQYARRESLIMQGSP